MRDQTGARWALRRTTTAVVAHPLVLTTIDRGSRRCLLGTVTAGIWLDNQELQRLAASTLDADLTLAIGDVPMASTIGRLTADDRVPATDGTRRGRLAGRQMVLSVQPLTQRPGERARLLVSIPATPITAGIDSRLLAIVLLGLVVVCVVATLLGSVLARLVSRPLGELAAQARAIARGGFTRPPSAVRSGGEVGELARAFERMRVELGEYLSALRSSRDELARSMNRLGETLSSTHDLPKLLSVVLEAAVQARRAKAGSLLLLTADRTALVREATYGLTTATRPSGSRSARASPGRSRPPAGPWSWPARPATAGPSRPPPPR